MECPACAALVKNVQLHFTRNTKCGDKIDIIIFQSAFKKQKWRDNMKINKQNHRTRQKEESNESYMAMKEKNRQDRLF